MHPPSPNTVPNQLAFRPAVLASLLSAGLLVVATGSGMAQEMPLQPAEPESSAALESAQPVPGVSSEPAITSDGDAVEEQAENPPQADASIGSDQPTRTQAEQDFDAIYGGGQTYNPVADPTLPTPAQAPVSYDPWEGFNRRMHSFNNVIDRRIARPLAQTYVKVVPRPVRLGVSNFFSNLGQPVSAINSALQGKPRQASQALGRFALNSTLGIGGIFDPATDANLPNKSEDFGQTLGIWGWERSRYVELPIFGPRTVRDSVGAVGDAPLSPLRQVELDLARVPLQGLQLVDVRTQLLSTDSLREGAADDYALVRDAWLQRRNYQIFGDRQLRDGDESDTPLPPYLLDDTNPFVPADTLPVLPPGN